MEIKELSLSLSLSLFLCAGVEFGTLYCDSTFFLLSLVRM